MTSMVYRQLLVPVALLAVLSCGLTAGACSASDASADLVEDSDVERTFRRAQEALGRGSVSEARHHYEQIPSHAARYAEAQLALALTDVLLLPSGPAATALLEALGADPARLPIDVEADLYGPGGFFHQLSSGASPELVDDSLRAMLPWSEAQLSGELSDLFAHVEPARTLEALRPALEQLDAELATIDARIALALDAGLSSYEVPRGALYGSRAHVLRRSEALVVRTVICGVRASIRLALAYHWPLSLRAAIGQLGDDGAPLSLVEVAALWNAGLARALDASRGLEHLAAARELAVMGLGHLREAHRVGREEARAGRPGVLDWLVFDDVGAAEFDAFWGELANAVASDTPHELRFALPQLVFTAAPLVSGALVRGDDAPPLVVVDDDDEELELDDEALRLFAIEPLFEPGWSPAEPPDLLGRSSLQDGATMRPSHGFTEQLEDDYNL